MSRFVSLRATSKQMCMSVIATGLLCAGVSLYSPADTQAATNPSTIPNFSPDANAVWVPDRPAGDDFLPPENGPGPVISDRAHAYSPLAQAQGQLQFHIADLSNPILKPWA